MGSALLRGFIRMYMFFISEWIGVLTVAHSLYHETSLSGQFLGTLRLSSPAVHLLTTLNTNVPLSAKCCGVEGVEQDCAPRPFFGLPELGKTTHLIHLLPIPCMGNSPNGRMFRWSVGGSSFRLPPKNNAQIFL